MRSKKKRPPGDEPRGLFRCYKQRYQSVTALTGLQVPLASPLTGGRHSYFSVAHSALALEHHLKGAGFGA